MRGSGKEDVLLKASLDLVVAREFRFADTLRPSKCGESSGDLVVLTPFVLVAVDFRGLLWDGPFASIDPCVAFFDELVAPVTVLLLAGL